MNCNLCDVAEAAVFCFADEAALCWNCNDEVHNVNKIASKHPRVPLITVPSHLPKCDICKEAVGYFFCVEDRCLLCRKCDVAKHVVNSIVATHNRFLLPGVKVGDENASSSSIGCSNETSRPEEPHCENTLPIPIAENSIGKNTLPIPIPVTTLPSEENTVAKDTPPNPLTSQYINDLPVQDSFTQNLNFQDSLGGEILPFGSQVGNVQQFHCDDLIEWATKDCNFIDNAGSSKSKADGEASSSHGVLEGELVRYPIWSVPYNPSQKDKDICNSSPPYDGSKRKRDS